MSAPSPTPAPAGVPDLGLTLPARTPRPAGGGPRRRGLTMMIDSGLPLGAFTDVVESHGGLVDLVKLGWCTALTGLDLARAKIDLLAGSDVDVCFGGTLLERVLAEDRPVGASLDAFTRFCEHFGVRTVEVSDGTVVLPAQVKARAIEVLAQRFTVFSEVGYKDPERAEGFSASAWVDGITADLAAGASHVVTESRESGASGIARPDGSLRGDVVDAVAAAGLDTGRLVFEAPTKALQIECLTLFGADVNLGNIAADDLVGVETLRLGLRSDTLLASLPGPPAVSRAADAR